MVEGVGFRKRNRRGGRFRVRVRGSPAGKHSSRVGPVDPSFRALSGRLKFTVRRNKFNKDSLSRGDLSAELPGSSFDHSEYQNRVCIAL